MKKLMISLSILLVLLAGCNYDTGEEINEMLVDIGSLGEDYDLARDINTGCVYVREVNYYTLTPYIGEDGKVVGCGEEFLNNSKYKFEVE